MALPAFLRHFASDRSHMVGEAGAGWMAPPPAWPPISAPGGAANTLPAFLDFSRAGAAGGAEEEASVQQRQRQRERHARGPSADDLGGGGRGADEDAPPFGVVLSEPAFLRRFGCQAGDEGD